MVDHTCAVNGCTKARDARGLCAAHYMKARKAGNLPPLLSERPLFLIDPPTGCWIWNRGVSNTGYGTHSIKGKSVLAHRWMYETLGQAEIPDGLHLDHLCRVRQCVNPAHLEPVTPWVKTECINGHEFTDENTYRPPSRPHTRQCRACMQERERRRVRVRRAA